MPLREEKKGAEERRALCLTVELVSNRSSFVEAPNLLAISFALVGIKLGAHKRIMLTRFSLLEERKHSYLYL